MPLGKFLSSGKSLRRPAALISDQQRGAGVVLYLWRPGSFSAGRVPLRGVNPEARMP